MEKQKIILPFSLFMILTDPPLVFELCGKAVENIDFCQSKMLKIHIKPHKMTKY